jgi:hypothetical protein
VNYEINLKILDKNVFYEMTPLVHIDEEDKLELTI